MLDAPVLVLPVSRRTRKRFTNAQLTMLENLFHQNSHPSREAREALARAGGMEIKSVTIWFQNKRQTERKSAATNSGQANSFNEHNVHPNITSAIHTFSLHSNDPVSSRPSLDRVAARSELRTPSHNRPHSPRPPPSHSAHPQRQLYDHLPSSPPYPPTSPPTSLARDFIEFGKSSASAKTRRTLEWACEAARIADKDKDRDKDVREASACTSSVNPGYHRHHIHQHHVTSASADVFPSSVSSRGRSAAHRERQPRYTNRRERETPARDTLTRPSSSVTLRGRSEGSFSSLSSSTRGDASCDITDSEDEAITPPTRWTSRLTKTYTNTSLTSSSSTSTTPSTSTSISREGSTTSTSTSFTNRVPMQAEDDAMFKAALALCGLGRINPPQNSLQRRL